MRSIWVLGACAVIVLISAPVLPTHALTKAFDPTQDVRVRVDCSSDPESVTIRNAGKKAFKVDRLRSIYPERPNESFLVDRVLRPRRSVTYRFGEGAGRNILTDQSIFENDRWLFEGVHVDTDLGRVTERCSTNGRYATGTIDVGEGITSIAATDDAIWVAGKGRVSRIDPVTRELTDTIPITGPTPRWLLVGPEAVWVVASGKKTKITRADMAGRARTFKLTTPGRPQAAIIAADSLWLLGSEFVEIDLASFEIQRYESPWSKPGAWAGVADGAIWMTQGSGLGRFDLSTREFTFVLTPPDGLNGDSPDCCVVIDDAIWMSPRSRRTAGLRNIRFDPATLDVSDLPWTGWPIGKAAVEAGDAVWLVDQDGGISRLDAGSWEVTKAMEVTKAFEIGAGHQRPVILDGAIWTSDRGSGGSVLRIDPETDDVTHQIGNLGDPRSLVAHSGAIWALDPASGAVTWIEVGESATRFTDETLRAVLTGDAEWANDVAFSPDGTTLASGSSDGTIVLWDVASETPIGVPLNGDAGPITSVAFSPDGSTLAAGTAAATIELWDVAAGSRIGEPLTGHEANDDEVGGEWRVNEVAFSPDGTTLASAGDDWSVILWDVASRTALGEPLTEHFWSVTSVAFGPDGTTLASGGGDGRIILWDVESQTSRGELGFHSQTDGHGLAFSPDGTTLASGGDDGSIMLWDVASRTALGELKEQAFPVVGVAFSPDGATLALANDDGIVVLWDVAERTRLGELLTGDTDGVSSVAFSPDGTTLASGSFGRIIVWDVPSWTARG